MIQPNKTWIKLNGVRQVNPIKVKLKFAPDDELDCVKFKRKLEGKEVSAVKVAGIMCYLWKEGKDYYLIEDFIVDGEEIKE